MTGKCALIMAGGTGGHIFPGLAVAHALRDKGWRIHWLGAPDSMESSIVPAQGIPLESVDFSGVRGKGPLTLALLPLKLLRAFWQSIQVVRRVKPDVVVGLGGYITFPGGMMGVLLGKPLVLHEQNSIAGMANKVLAGVADRIYTAFPNVFNKGQWIGNPLRPGFLAEPLPSDEHSFKARVDEGRARLNLIAQEVARQALAVLTEYAAATRKLKPKTQKAQQVMPTSSSLKAQPPSFHFNRNSAPKSAKLGMKSSLWLTNQFGQPMGASPFHAERNSSDA